MQIHLPSHLLLPSRLPTNHLHCMGHFTFTAVYRNLQSMPAVVRASVGVLHALMRKPTYMALAVCSVVGFSQLDVLVSPGFTQPLYLLLGCLQLAGHVSEAGVLLLQALHMALCLLCPLQLLLQLLLYLQVAPQAVTGEETCTQSLYSSHFSRPRHRITPRVPPSTSFSGASAVPACFWTWSRVE